VSATNGHSTEDPAVVAGARPVVLVRYRSGVAGETSRLVHVVPLSLAGQTSAAGLALCGALLCPDEVETVAPGHGVPCSLCLISHVSGDVPPTSVTARPAEAPGSETGPLAAAVGYRVWGWPVVLRGEQVWLTLEPNIVALIIPVLLAVPVADILNQRRCPPPVLVDPDMLEHRVVLAGQPYGVGLPWPSGVHRVTGPVLLPPTRIARGLVTWVYPPQADALQLCREIDVFAALRTALRDPPP
jgi:hypothetical protein